LDHTLNGDIFKNTSLMLGLIALLSPIMHFCTISFAQFLVRDPLVCFSVDVPLFQVHFLFYLFPSLTIFSFLPTTTTPQLLIHTNYGGCNSVVSHISYCCWENGEGNGIIGFEEINLETNPGSSSSKYP